MTSRHIRGRTAYFRGLAAESRAITLLESEGWSVLATRLRTPHGELDIVAANEAMLLVVEIKCRERLSEAAFALSQQQASRILNGADFIFQTRPEWQRAAMRLDLMIFDKSGDARRIRDALRLV